MPITELAAARAYRFGHVHSTSSPGAQKPSPEAERPEAELEALMRTGFFLAAAALLLASTAAHAGNGISFKIDGQKIHIDAPRNCSSLSCISVTNNGSAI